MHSLEGNKGCRVNFERTGEKKALYMSSQEPGESSQASALEFVDQFLSLNKMYLSPQIGIKKTVWEKSLRVSSGKRPQSLAKRMKFRKTTISKSGTFDWADTDKHGKDDALNKNGKSPLKFGALRQIPVTGDLKAEDCSSEECRSSGNEHEEKKELVNLENKITVSNHSHSRVHSPKETCGMEELSKMNLQNSSFKELNDDFHTESPDQWLEDSGTGRETPDMIDVGFSTQIAAEAMEALSYAPFAGCTVLNADPGPLETTDDSPKGVIMGKAWSGHASLQMRGFSGLGGFARKSKRRKRTARKFGKNSIPEEPNPELAMKVEVRMGKFLTGEQYMNSANSNETSGRRCHRLVIKGQADGTVGRNKKQCENYILSISVEQAEEKLKNTSTVAQDRVSLTRGTLRRTNNQSDNPRDGMEDGITKFRRKRSRLVGDPTKVASDGERWLELHSNSPAEARNNMLNEGGQICKVVTATTSCLKLGSWCHPKGKRTLHKVQSHSNGTTCMHKPLAAVNGKEGNHCGMKSQKEEDNNNTSRYNEGMKGKPQSVYSNSPLHPLEMDRSKNFNEPGSAVVNDNNESASVSKGISPVEMNEINFPVFSNSAENNHKFRESSGKNLEPPCSGYTSTVNFIKGINMASSSHMPSKYHKKPFNKNLPKSSLLKELIRLGVSESISDYTWKDLRRRRDMAHIRVLFSQHLADDVIKQQKKVSIFPSLSSSTKVTYSLFIFHCFYLFQQISARLGISIATSPVDATHFIADRFVRTRNMLETIALGKPVVTHLWLESCGQASCLIDEKNYILRDDKKEKEIGFSMPVTFARANKHPLLKVIALACVKF